MPGSPSTADGTGAAMQALSPDSKAVHRGISYLRQAQRPGGGFPLGGNGAVNTQSTAWAIQGILAAGGDPSSYRRGGASAPEYLANQQEKNGHYRYSKSSDQTPIWVTAQVLVAAAGQVLPNRTTAPRTQAILQQRQHRRRHSRSHEPCPSSDFSRHGPAEYARSLTRLPNRSRERGWWTPPERFAPPGPVSPRGVSRNGSPRGAREGGVHHPRN